MSTDFQVPTISSEQVDENKGVFTIEPLDDSFASPAQGEPTKLMN